MSESIYDEMALASSALMRLSEVIEDSRDEIRGETYGGRDFCARRDRIYARMRETCRDVWSDAHGLTREIEAFVEMSKRTDASKDEAAHE